jgi:hypothetical protein
MSTINDFKQSVRRMNPEVTVSNTIGNLDIFGVPKYKKVITITNDNLSKEYLRLTTGQKLLGTNGITPGVSMTYQCKFRFLEYPLATSYICAFNGTSLQVTTTGKLRLVWGFSESLVTSNAIFQPGQVYDLVVIKNDTTKTINIYVDTQLVFSTAYINNGNESSSIFLLGDGTGTGLWNLDLFGLLVYNFAWSAGQISNYPSTKPTGSIIDFRFEAFSPTKLIDFAGGDNSLNITEGKIQHENGGNAVNELIKIPFTLPTTEEFNPYFRDFELYYDETRTKPISFWVETINTTSVYIWARVNLQQSTNLLVYLFYGQLGTADKQNKLAILPWSNKSDLSLWLQSTQNFESIFLSTSTALSTNTWLNLSQNKYNLKKNGALSAFTTVVGEYTDVSTYGIGLTLDNKLPLTRITSIAVAKGSTGQFGEFYSDYLNVGAFNHNINNATGKTEFKTFGQTAVVGNKVLTNANSPRFISTVTQSKDVTKMYYNGYGDYINTNTTYLTTSAVNGISQIGDNLQCGLYELLIFKEVVTDNELFEIHRYLQLKYNLYSFTPPNISISATVNLVLPVEEVDYQPIVKEFASKRMLSNEFWGLEDTQIDVVFANFFFQRLVAGINAEGWTNSTKKKKWRSLLLGTTLTSDRVTIYKPYLKTQDDFFFTNKDNFYLTSSDNLVFSQQTININDLSKFYKAKHTVKGVDFFLSNENDYIQFELFLTDHTLLDVNSSYLRFTNQAGDLVLDGYLSLNTNTLQNGWNTIRIQKREFTGSGNWTACSYYLYPRLKTLSGNQNVEYRNFDLVRTFDVTQGVFRQGSRIKTGYYVSGDDGLSWFFQKIDLGQLSETASQSLEIKLTAKSFLKVLTELTHKDLLDVRYPRYLIDNITYYNTVSDRIINHKNEVTEAINSILGIATTAVASLVGTNLSSSVYTLSQNYVELGTDSSLKELPRVNGRLLINGNDTLKSTLIDLLQLNLGVLSQPANRLSLKWYKDYLEPTTFVNISKNLINEYETIDQQNSYYNKISFTYREKGLLDETLWTTLSGTKYISILYTTAREVYNQPILDITGSNSISSDGNSSSTLTYWLSPDKLNGIPISFPEMISYSFSNTSGGATDNTGVTLKTLNIVGDNLLVEFKNTSGVAKYFINAKINCTFLPVRAETNFTTSKTKSIEKFGVSQLEIDSTYINYPHKNSVLQDAIFNYHGEPVRLYNLDCEYLPDVNISTNVSFVNEEGGKVEGYVYAITDNYQDGHYSTRYSIKEHIKNVKYLPYETFSPRSLKGTKLWLNNKKELTHYVDLSQLSGGQYLGFGELISPINPSTYFQFGGIVMWVNPIGDSNILENYIFTAGAITGSLTFRTAILNSDLIVYFAGVSQTFTGVFSTLNTWYHLAFKTTATGWLVYVNNINIGTVITGTAQANMPNDVIKFGGSGVSRRFPGQFHDIRVYESQSVETSVFTSAYLGENENSFRCIGWYPMRIKSEGFVTDERLRTSNQTAKNLTFSGLVNWSDTYVSKWLDETSSQNDALNYRQGGTLQFFKLPKLATQGINLTTNNFLRLSNSNLFTNSTSIYAVVNGGGTKIIGQWQDNNLGSTPFDGDKRWKLGTYGMYVNSVNNPVGNTGAIINVNEQALFTQTTTEYQKTLVYGTWSAFKTSFGKNFSNLSNATTTVANLADSASAEPVYIGGVVSGNRNDGDFTGQIYELFVVDNDKVTEFERRELEEYIISKYFTKVTRASNNRPILDIDKNYT